MYSSCEYFNCDNIWNTFIISDTHFNHFKMKDGVMIDNTIARYTGRPDDWQERIITNWNNVVGVDDLVLHLGDLTFGNIDRAYEVVHQLKGNKFLLKGNHDKRSVKWFDRIGFTLIKKSFIVNCPEMDIHFLFSHRPQFNVPPGTVNVHGHWHEKAHFIKESGGVTYINASVEKMKYTPKRLHCLMRRTENLNASLLRI